MTDEQKRVHFRLSTTLPVRTHTWEPMGRTRSLDQEEQLGERLRQLRAAGYKRNDMKIKLGVSCQTIIKHLGRQNKKRKK